MPSLFDDVQCDIKLNNLIQRILRVHRGIQTTKKISQDQIEDIGRLNTTQLAARVKDIQSKDDSDTLKILFNLLINSEEEPESSILDKRGLVEGLKLFEEEQGEYLPILPLTVDNQETIATELNDFAVFYQVFIQYLKVSTRLDDEDQTAYTLDFDLLAAKETWIEWQRNRPTQIVYDPTKPAGLVEKLLVGQLKPNEWLSDLDLHRALKIFDLTETNTHIIPFTSDDLGLTIHFERQKHERDHPKRPYFIPLLVNLGDDDHSQINSRGCHWTRMLIKIDPRRTPPTIVVDYNDSLPILNKEKIKNTIREGLQYHDQQGVFSAVNKEKVYAAFPDCDHPTITINDSDEQQDGYTCGYRALQGLIGDLQRNYLLSRATHQDFLRCDTPTAIRNYIYNKLISEQPIAQATVDDIINTHQHLKSVFKPSDQEGFQTIDQAIIEGQLLFFEQRPSKQSKQKPLDPLFLKQLAENQQIIEALIAKLNHGKIVAYQDGTTTIDFDYLMNKDAEFNGYDRKLMIQAIFLCLQRNKTINSAVLMGMDNVTADEIEAVKKQLDNLDNSIAIECFGPPDVQETIRAIQARNRLLGVKEVPVKDRKIDPWGVLFHTLALEIPHTSRQHFDLFKDPERAHDQPLQNLGLDGVKRLLEYMGENRTLFTETSFPYKTFSTASVLDHGMSLGLDFLDVLIEHFQLEFSCTLFNNYIITITNLDSVDKEQLLEKLKILLESFSKAGIEILEIQTRSCATLTPQDIQLLLDFAQENQISTFLNITISEPNQIDPNVQAKLTALGNQIANNRRNPIPIAENEEDVADDTETEDESKTLGKIGRAILGQSSTTELETEVQQQQQIQQQVQQQVQTIVTEDALDENRVEDERFLKFTSGETAYDRQDFILNMQDFISARYNMEAGACWDLLFGQNSFTYKYGITTVTASAVKFLIDHLESALYSFHPDNLPAGFGLREKGEGLVLMYDPVNPPLNLKQSHLTPTFSRPKVKNHWYGNALQFISEEQAKNLHKDLYRGWIFKKPALDDVIDHFFYLNEPQHPGMDLKKRQKILAAFISGSTDDETLAEKTNAQLDSIFGKELTAENIAALAEILYEKGVVSVSNLLNQLERLKQLKGDEFFQHVKTCYLDTSTNWSELISDASLNAIQKLLAFNELETEWWMALGKQPKLTETVFGQNEKYAEYTLTGQRWTNLAETTNACDYFFAEIKNKYPRIELSSPCPFENLPDMRVGLNRLLTMQEKALDPLEACETWPNTSLQGLGAFYAARREGFRVTHPDMLLSDGEIPLEDNTNGHVQIVEERFNFRVKKENVLQSLHTLGNLAKKQALYLRFVATYNHRAPIADYIEAFRYLSHEHGIHHDNFDHLIAIMAIFGVGKRAKKSVADDCKKFIDFAKDKPALLLHAWIEAFQKRLDEPNLIKPTLSDIVDISELAASEALDEPDLNDLQALKAIYGEHAELFTQSPAYKINIINRLHASFVDKGEPFIQALVKLSKNAKKMSLSVLLYGLTKVNPIGAAAPLYAAGNPSLRASIVKLFSICQDEGGELNVDNIEKTIRDIYEKIDIIVQIHGKDVAENLIEILSQIEVENSPTLFSMDELTLLVDTVAAYANKPSYNELLALIQERLPEGCILITHNIIPPPPTRVGNLHAIFAKHMDEVIKGFKAMEDQVNAYVAWIPGIPKVEIPKEIMDDLYGPSGPAHLIEALEALAKLEEQIDYIAKEVEKIPGVGAMAVGMIRGVYDSLTQILVKTMLDIYNDSITAGLQAIPVQGNIAGKLNLIIRHRIPHPFLDGAVPFKRLCKSEEELSFSKQCSHLDRVLTDLRFIQNKWPEDFDRLVNMIGDCPHLGEYSFGVLREITTLFLNNYPKAAKFPLNAVAPFFAVPAISQANILIILNSIFDQSNQFSEQEYELLCKLAVAYSQQQDNGVTDYLQKLYNLKDEHPELYLFKLTLLQGGLDPEESIRALTKHLKTIEDVGDPEFSELLFHFFGEHPDDFFNILDQNISKEILTIIIKATQGPKGTQKPAYVLENINRCIEQLKQLDDNDLQKLLALYSLPDYPILSMLNDDLDDGLDLEKLEQKYDRDPPGKRTDPQNGAQTLREQFDTSRVARLIDNMKDLNYDRSLLLSERQELQRWFLYINTIGMKQPIACEPDPKAIKDMSHAEIHAVADKIQAFVREHKDSNDPLVQEKITKAKLEYIAIMREVMYRMTGRFPFPTQILYLLRSLQSSGNFVAQINTGQGKSLTAAMTGALLSLEGKTVDICTSNLFLAQEGLDENARFFDYLGVTAKLITQDSPTTDYEKGGIHYSSLADMALARTKMQLVGEELPEDSVIIADEIDFSTLDDSTRYRFATCLDPVIDPYVSPYVWIYEALIRFADTQNDVQSDTKFLNAAQKWLEQEANDKEKKNQLKQLKAQPELFKQRLTTWLIAAGETKNLVEQEELTTAKYRVVTLTHPTFGFISKACKLNNNRPDIPAEISKTVQQFLHMRLREKYKLNIQNGTMPDFLVEPEKTYITSLNSKLLLKQYQRQLGMSGTVGSRREIKEQHANYGFRFVDIPSFQDNRLKELTPVLTNANYSDNPALEANDHLNKIVKDILRHLDQKAKGQRCDPVLVLCKSKTEGEEIRLALLHALESDHQRYAEKYQNIQSFYSSLKPSSDERNQEEKALKKAASLDGCITISSVFDRGTDIDPEKDKPNQPDSYLYVVQTYVDTEPNTVEDLERAKRQKIGRSARKGRYGEARLIVKRSEFSPVYDTHDMKRIEASVQGLDKAIADLNHHRNQQREEERKRREAFDDLKDILFKQFFQYIQFVNDSRYLDIPQKEIRNQLLKTWNSLLQRVDEEWEALRDEDDFDNQIAKLADFANEQWTVMNMAQGAFPILIRKWCERYKYDEPLPGITLLDTPDVLKLIKKRYATLHRQYVKQGQCIPLDSSLSGDQVYCDFAALDTDTIDQEKIKVIKKETTLALFNDASAKFLSLAYKWQLRGKYDFSVEVAQSELVEGVFSAILFLRYKAYRDGNPLAHAEFKKQYQKLMNAVLWSGDPELIDALDSANQHHVALLSSHQGDHEKKKTNYLCQFMTELNDSMPAGSPWKKTDFDLWWVFKANTQGYLGYRKTIIFELKSYRDHWWARGWVSSDRHALANQLIGLLNEQTEPLDILSSLNQIRVKLLADDKAHGRKIKAGLNGRLNASLDDIRSRVISACDPDTVDKLIALEFTDMKQVLGAFAVELPDVVALTTITQGDWVLSTKDEIQDRHDQIMRFFSSISSLANRPQHIKKANLRSLLEYCQLKNKELARYFAQSNQYRALNERGSVAVFTAASEAATTVSSSLKNVDEKATKTTYRKRRFAVEINEVDQGIKETPFYIAINHPNNYKYLFAEIEKKVIETLPGDNHIQFKKITVANSDHFENEGFCLTIDFSINGVQAQVYYHFNVKQQTVYCDNESLRRLDEDLAPLKSRFDEFGQKLTVLNQDALMILQQTKKAQDASKALRPVDEAIRQAYEVYLHQLKDDDEKLDFEAFLQQMEKWATGLKVNQP